MTGSDVGLPVARPRQRATVDWHPTTGELLFNGDVALMVRSDRVFEPLYLLLRDEYGPELSDLLMMRTSIVDAEVSWQRMQTRTGDSSPRDVIDHLRERLSDAGWGQVEITHYDPDAASAELVVDHAFELAMQHERKPSDRTGAPFLVGKLLGCFEQAFGVVLRAEVLSIDWEPAPRLRLRFGPGNESVEEEFNRRFTARLDDTSRKLLAEIDRRNGELLRSKQRLTHHAANLEGIVRSRTADLEDALSAVESEHAERLRVEAELVESQKLEALGQLSAGVAHEINTPVQFIGDSLHFLRRSFGEMIEALERIDDLAQALPGDTGAALSSEIDQLDLPYLVARVPRALDRAVDGVGRVADIVRAMKEFVHPDHGELAASDLNRAIENTLVISTSAYKFHAEVTTDFGDLPPVVCQISEINQVILNVVTNAAHAIGDGRQDTDPLGSIEIRTFVDGDDAVITISDTGGGIPDDVKARMFDPFFTTKDVGIGTGQGLAISRTIIVDKHQGEIDVATEMDIGTTFTFRLPIAGPSTTESTSTNNRNITKTDTIKTSTTKTSTIKTNQCANPAEHEE